MANPQKGPAPRRLDALSLATLGGVLLLLGTSYAQWREIRRVDAGLGGRLEKIETRLGQVAAKVGQAPAQRPSGPDPNKVYAVNVANAPVKGPATAPVTIVEFSDFQ